MATRAMNCFCFVSQSTRVRWRSRSDFDRDLSIDFAADVMDSAQSIVLAMRKFKLDPVEPVNRVYADRILDYRIDHDPSQALSEDIVRAVESLWHDPIIPTVLDRASEFYLMDSASYFFDEVQRIGSSDYIPNETDVLRARTKTTGISETKFRSGQLSIHMFDVGGQRSERKKVITFCPSFYFTLTGCRVVSVDSLL